jgi:aminobenzoyl-glutamate utilization protein A
MPEAVRNRLVELRRSFHRYPEPAWREFYTTDQIVSELESIGVDEIAVGPDAYDPADRMAVPDPEEIEPWLELARERGADENRLSKMEGGNTGVIAVLDQGEGPVVGLRVDIDGLFVKEAEVEEHEPVNKGFRSQYDETMHACGHDAHITWGLSVLEAIASSDFTGQFVVFFQPAEEVSGGGYQWRTATLPMISTTSSPSMLDSGIQREKLSAASNDHLP